MSKRPIHHRRRRSWPAVVLVALVAACGGSDGALPDLPGGETMQLTSTAFVDGATIPVRHTCDGEGTSPPLRIAGVPEGAASLALVVEDPDAPRGTFVHWVVFDVPVTGEIPEGAAPGTRGSNSRGRTGYTPPCPPSGSHRYVFDVYALDTELGLDEGATADDVRRAMETHVLAAGRLVGRYRG